MVSVAVDIVLFVGAFDEISDQEVTVIPAKVNTTGVTCCRESIFRSRLHALCAAPRNLPVYKKKNIRLKVE